MNVNICKFCHDKATNTSCMARDTFIALCQAFHDKGYRAAWLPPAGEHTEFLQNLLIKIEYVERLGWIVTHETDQGYWMWPKYMNKIRNFKKVKKFLEELPVEHGRSYDDVIVFCIEGGHLGLACE